MLNALRVGITGLVLAIVIIAVGYWAVMAGPPPSESPPEIRASAVRIQADAPIPCFIVTQRDVLIRLATYTARVPVVPLCRGQIVGRRPAAGGHARDWIQVMAVAAQRAGPLRT